MTESYSLNVHCSNCTWRGRAVIGRGTLVVQVRCPHCDAIGALRAYRRPLLSNLWRSDRSAWS